MSYINISFIRRPISR